MIIAARMSTINENAIAKPEAQCMRQYLIRSFAQRREQNGYTEHDLAHQAESASHILRHLVTGRRN